MSIGRSQPGEPAINLVSKNIKIGHRKPFTAAAFQHCLQFSLTSTAKRFQSIFHTKGYVLTM